MSVLKVMPGEKPKEIDIDLSLESLQNEVGGYIQAIYPFDCPVAIICNEEAKFNGMRLNRVLRDKETDEIYDVISGNFLVVGLCEDDFMDLTPELLKFFKYYYHEPEFFFAWDGHLYVIGRNSNELIF